ncbi:hypothetical protein [Pleionea litopenaei]|uniref:Uncharacterized protein n=1 Tax=Pleionea litopenaei TaxID=3070815 RepID=A0AA51X731_9GAMM|nr:hypothetical protein [Pleionea sp. HL-JVS1]WMS87907.1 hypothetical protein Q9312_03055 [Pleionea sp. HL-JVS1]
MPIKDKKHINFSEDYELNNRLRRNKKRQTEENRQKLRDLGDKTKNSLDKSRLTHDELDKAIQKNKQSFD